MTIVSILPTWKKKAYNKRSFRVLIFLSICSQEENETIVILIYIFKAHFSNLPVKGFLRLIKVIYKVI